MHIVTLFLIVNNFSGANTAISHYNSRCVVNSSGTVVWVPPSQFTVLCNLNLKYWPFDTQTCNMFFLSWTHSGDEIDLKIHGNLTTPQVRNDS